MTLGLVARNDSSGLANLTDQLVRALTPDRVLIVDMGVLSRGWVDTSRYHLAYKVSYQQPNDETIRKFCDGLDTLLTAETWYWPQLAHIAAKSGARLVLYAMPELWNPRELNCIADTVAFPWRADSTREFPGLVLPWWAPSSDVLPRLRGQDGVVTFVHQPAAAMRDRNGTDLVLAACTHVTVPCALLLNGTGAAHDIGKVRVTYTGNRLSSVKHWQDLYTVGDVLLLPRRYGCLSLPMYEAAAAGMPMITTALLPQTEIFADCSALFLSCPESELVPMKGGPYNVWSCDPSALAKVMDAVAGEPALVEKAGVLARRWAVSHGLDHVAHLWNAAVK